MEGALSGLKKKRISELKFTRFLLFYMDEAVISLRRSASANEHLVSPMTFAGAVSHFSINLYSIGALYYQFEVLSSGDRVMLCCLISLQALFFFGTVKALVRMDRDLALPGTIFGKVQMFLGGGRGNGGNRWRPVAFLTATKVNVLSLYEQFHSEAAFRFTFGPMGAKFTSKAVYEVKILKFCLL